jgi:hypothetical protein
MFIWDDNLSSIKAMVLDRTSTNDSYGWLTGVASTGTFTKNSAATWPDSDYIPSGWTVQTASS